MNWKSIENWQLTTWDYWISKSKFRETRSISCQQYFQFWPFIVELAQKIVTSRAWKWILYVFFYKTISPLFILRCVWFNSFIRYTYMTNVCCVVKIFSTKFFNKIRDNDFLSFFDIKKWNQIYTKCYYIFWKQIIRLLILWNQI